MNAVIEYNLSLGKCSARLCHLVSCCAGWTPAGEVSQVSNVLPFSYYYFQKDVLGCLLMFLLFIRRSQA
uniref:Phenylalanyl-tRNA synthetase beta chain n=1 Tax=Rhizophora mucronata TaxID=61149 RepID=A0A2P2MTM7_RHIMU